MNFVGKFDANLPIEGSVAHPVAFAHVDGASTHAPSDAIIVPDAQLLFGGDFKRSGVDLVLSNDDHELVLHDYFKGEKRAALASPDGAHLTGDLVNALTGHVEYAQADGAVAAAAAVVGHVSKLTGTATAIRNGVSIILNQGDNIDKGDVLQSGADSTLGVTFIDGTVFGLSSNARMVVNEMIYDPNGSNNSSLLSLVAGTISFVAGETAKHGDMKVDTPVATMGIRGTAVLVEIDFSVPGQNGAPSANFQVLVEPDGTTGSYILFDKNTLAPLATVNTAGTLTKISQGIVSFQAGTPLTPDEQKLITDLFTTKFGDNTNTKTTDHAFTDTPVPQSLAPIKLADGTTAILQIVAVNNSNGSSPSGSGPGTAGILHIPGPPTVVTSNDAFTELSHVTGSTAFDTITDKIKFADINATDLPTVKVEFSSFTYQDAHHNDITHALSPTEQAAIKAVEAIDLHQDPGNNNNGAATWTYSYPDGSFDFLGAGETLTLTYTALVDNNFLQSPEIGTQQFTITITGTNDVPVITSSIPQTIAFIGGTSVPGGDLTAHVPTSGTISFDDPDLTDTHTVSVKLLLDGLDLPPTPLQLFEHALTASISTDSTGTGFGTVDWKLADLPVYLADFIPKGETISLVYAVTVTDSQGATSTQDITVTITGTDTPAVVWIATAQTGSAPGGLWSDAANWETGTVPTANDDAIIITDQLIGLTPSYPVTIDATTAAVAKSVTMNDFGTSPPELINLGTLTIRGAFNMSADSVLHNSGGIAIGGGGSFADQSTITNTSTGLIEVSGGTLNVGVDIANAGQVAIDYGATLALGNAAVDGGAVINQGTFDLTGNAVVKNGTLYNTNQINVSGTGNAFVNETIDNGSSSIPALFYNLKPVSNDPFLDDPGPGGSIFTIVMAPFYAYNIKVIGTLTLDGATISGGSVSDNGTIDVTGDSTITGASVTGGLITVEADQTLTLDGTSLETSFGEGSITILPDAPVVTENGFTDPPGVAVDPDGVFVSGSTITNDGTIKVDANNGIWLSNTAITGGTIDNSGSIEIVGSSSIDNDTLNNNQLTVDTSQTLTLDGTTVTGGTVSNYGTLAVDADQTLTLQGGVAVHGGTLDNSGTVDIEGSSGATLDGVTVTGGGDIQIDGDSDTTTTPLVLEGGTTVTDGTLTVGSVGVLDVKTTGATLHDVGVTNHNSIEVFGGSALTLDDGTSVTNADGTIAVDSTATLMLNDATISGGTLNNSGTVHVEGSSGATLDGVTVTGGGDIQIDGSTTLTLDHAIIDGSTVDDFSTPPSGSIIAGDIDVIGSSTISNAQLNHGDVTIESGQTLTLDGDTVTGTAFTGVAAGSIIEVDGGDTLTLNSATVSGGGVTIGADALVKTSGDVTLTNTSVTNDGTIEVTGGTLTITGSVASSGPDASGSIKIDSGALLDLDGSDTQNVVFAGSNGELQIDTSSFGGSISGLAATDEIDLSGISYGLGTTATYSDGVLTITDGSHPPISMTLVGDYSAAHFAGSSDSHGGTLITLNANDDAPVFAEKSEAAAVSELADTAGSTVPDSSASGTLHFTDIDLTDRPTATITQSVTWTNGTTDPSSSLTPAEISALEQAFSLTQSDNTNNGTIGWSYQISDSALDFLGTGETATVTSTVLLDDHQNGHDTAIVTVMLTGTNDAPVLAVDTSGAGGTGTHAIAELAGQTGDTADHDSASGTLTFTDANLDDTHTLSHSGPTYVWSGGVLNTAETNALTAAGQLNLSEIDSTDIGTGSIAFSYSAADGSFDFLAGGQTLTVSYTITVTDNSGASSSQPVTFTINGSNDAPVLAVDHSGANGLHAITELAGKTGDTGDVDSASGTLSFTDVDLSDTHTVSQGAPTYVWSGGSLTTAQTDALAATLALTETDSTHTGSGSIGFTYSAADSSFDFLAAGETLKVTYGVTVTDNHGISSIQPVTITITGTNDAPLLAADSSGANGMHAITELAGKTGDTGDVDSAAGTLSFTDVDLDDTHTISQGAPTYAWSGGSLTQGQADALTAAGQLTLSEIDSTHTGSGSVNFSYSAADSSFDFLAVGETLKVTYGVTVTDNHGVSSIQPVTITITGTNDAPVLAADHSGTNGTGLHAITELAGKTGDTGDVDSAAGTLSFTDVDLTDTHTVSQGAPTYVWSGGGLTQGETDALTAAGQLTLSEIDSTRTGSGSVGFSYSAADSSFDFLAAGETLKVTYGVTVTDNHGISSIQPVTITITGSNDAPVLAVDHSGTNGTTLHAITELAGKTDDTTDVDSASGMLSFTDVDLSDTHTVSQGAPTYVWSGGSLTTAQTDALAAAATLALTETDSTDTGSGSVGFTYSAADSSFDFLAVGETLKVTYGVTVTDDHGGSSTAPVTITITGTNDAPTLAADHSGANGQHAIAELAGKTGDTIDHDSASGTLSFTDVDLDDTHTVSQGTPVYVWSGGSLTTSQTDALTAAATLALTETDSTHTGTGSVGFTYSAPDGSFDFLAAGETLTVTYGVTLTDNHGIGSTQPVTMTITGTNDAPALAVDNSGANGLHAITELAGKTGDTTDVDSASGTLSFTDADLTDTHTVSQGTPTYVWSGGSLTGTQTDALTAAATLTLTETDSTHGGSGSVGFTYSAADNSFDFLAAGETLKVTYAVAVTDSHGISSTQPVTITITGTNDAPVLAADHSGANGLHAITELAGQTGDTTDVDSATGTLSFIDVDLDDAHTVSQSTPTYLWSGGSLTTAQTNALTVAATLALTETDSTHSGAGSVGFTYGAADSSFDFLAAGETLKITYGVTVTDSHNGGSTQPVTITITGTNDAPVLAADTSGANGLHAITEIASKTGDTTDVDSTAGTLSFIDVDLDDTHTVSQGTPTYVWSGGSLTTSQTDALTTAATLVLTETDSTHSGTGSVGFTYSAADNSFDFLAAGETLKVTYAVTLTDSHGISSTQPVTMTITGTNDAPVLAADHSGGNGLHTITELAGKIDDTTDVDSATGTLSFTDADLTDKHTVSQGTPTYVWSGGSPTGTQTDALTAAATLILTETESAGSGSIGFAYGAADSNFDFLAAGETLKAIYGVTVTDNHGASSIEPVTITINGTNDAPVLTADHSGPNGTGLHAISELAGKTGDTVDHDSASGMLSFTDADLDDTHTLSHSGPTYVLSSGTLDTTQADALTAAATLALTETDSTHSAAGSVSFSYSAPDSSFDFLAEGQTLTVGYSITVTDNSGVSSSQPVTFSVTGSNDAPAMDAHHSTLSYIENQAPTAIDAALTLSDVDSATLGSATVQISGNFVAGDDVLGFIDQNGIHGSYDAVHGILTLTGTSSVANYQAALASVTYFDDSDNPSAAPRTISFSVDDGANANSHSNTVAAAVDVTPVNDPPVVTFAAPENGAISVPENAATHLTGLSVSDVDAGISDVTLTLALPDGSSGSLSAGNFDGVTIGGSATALTITGSLVEINTFLADTRHGVTYTPATDVIHDVTLTATANDHGATGAGGAMDSAPQSVLFDLVPDGQPTSHANLVVNGGFETGDFSGWSLGNDTGDRNAIGINFLVGSVGAENQHPGDMAHHGQAEALFGGIGDDVTLSQSQTLATNANEHYTVDFWLMNDTSAAPGEDGRGSNNFSASWNGIALMPTIVNANQSSSYTEYQFDVTGVAGHSTLEFSARNDDGYWNLDDVSVREGAPDTVNLLTDETISVSGVHAGDALTVTPTDSNSLGTVSAAAGTGSIEWQFAAGNAQFDHLMALTQTYTVSDANDPAVAQTVAVSIGGLGHDQFVFNPDIGADTMVNFNTVSNSQGSYVGDTVELDNFSNIQSVSDVLHNLSTDAHGNAVVDLGNHDSITFQGINAATIQTNAMHMFVLHSTSGNMA